MNSGEKEQKIFLTVFFILIIAFSGFYFLNPKKEVENNNQEISKNEEMPSNLVEGTISEIDSERLLLDIIKPAELTGEQMEVNLEGNTNYNELTLEERGRNDVRNLGTESMESEKLDNGSRILVTFSKEITSENFSNNNLKEINVTLITVQKAN
jgi:hypothetical protein